MDITLHQIAKSYGPTLALHPLDLHIRSGDFTTLLGPSGCGKTTLLRLIAGLETPDSGTMQFGDEVVYDDQQAINKPVHKRGLGMVFQDFALWPHLTVFENVAFGLRAEKRTADLQQRVSEAIQAVRLGGFEQRYPHQLSGGQQQRVAFARAIAVRPQVILFDEPLSALDATLREEMRGELTAMVRDFGLTAVYVTHDQDEAMTMSDQVVVMRQGRIQQIGTPQEIYERPATAEVAGFIGKSNWLQGGGMVRPEKLSWQPRLGANECSGTIRRVAYTGERYEFELSMADGGTWTAYHEQHQETGATCLLYVNPQDIHYVQIEEEMKR